MSFYIRCPTCGGILTENYAEYNEELEAIQEDPRRSRDQKEVAIADLITRYGHRRYCCRARVKCTIPLHKIIQS